MKKSNLILAAMAILGLAACSKPQTEVAPKIDLSQSEVSFEVEGGEATISFTSAREWEVTAPDNDWLLVEPSKGEGSDKPQTITLRATANTGANQYRRKPQPRTDPSVYFCPQEDHHCVSDR